jgi:hypothetical protein
MTTATLENLQPCEKLTLKRAIELTLCKPSARTSDASPGSGSHRARRRGSRRTAAAGVRRRRISAFDIHQAEATLAAWSGQLELADKRYNAGLGNIIELTDAERFYIQDDAAYVDSLSMRIQSRRLR